MVFLQRLVPRQPWEAAGPQLPIACAECWPAAWAVRMVVMSSGLPLLLGLEVAP